MIMKWNVNLGEKIQLEGSDIEEVEKFVYLGAMVTTTGGAGEDISARLGKAQTVFCNLKNIWKNSQLSINTKRRIFRSSVLAVLLYGCETWQMIKSDETKLNAGLLILRDGAISHNRPQIASDRTIHKKSRNSQKIAHFSQNQP